MAQLHQVLVAMAQATQRYKEEDARLAEEHRSKYGIDVSREFSFQYATPDDSSSAGAAPAKPSKPSMDKGSETGVDSLLE